MVEKKTLVGDLKAAEKVGGIGIRNGKAALGDLVGQLFGRFGYAVV